MMQVINPFFNTQSKISDVENLTEQLLALSGKDSTLSEDVLALSQKDTSLTEKDTELEGKIDDVKQTDIPDLQQLIFNVSKARNILINPNFQENQRSFDGDWSKLATGDYGHDCWCKTDTGIAQMVEEGHYTPNTTYTLSGQGVVTKQIDSPNTGHWRIDVPDTASKVVLNEGAFAMPYIEPDNTLNRSKCWERYFAFSGRVHANPWQVDNESVAALWNHCDVFLPVRMRISPIVSYLAHVNWVSAPGIAVYSGRKLHIAGQAPNTSGSSVDGLVCNADIALT